MHTRRSDADGARAQADALRIALRALGLSGSVEVRDRLAVLRTTAANADRLADPELRKAAFAAAREHGFTHLALELGTDMGVAPDTDIPPNAADLPRG